MIPLTLALVLEYDGTNFGGWQIQPNSPSIQEEIQKSLHSLTGLDYNVVGAGRTDAGVHARGQVANLRLDPAFPIPEDKIADALNAKLDRSIYIKKAVIFPYEFHARFDATAREYSYTFSRKRSVFNSRFTSLIAYPMDDNLLMESSSLFIGKHDFTAFSKNNPSTLNYVCEVEICKWEPVDIDTWQLRVKADRFVYGMVRSLTGAMIDVARGKKTLIEVASALDNEKRENLSPLAPPQGLVLERIYYLEKMEKFLY